MNIWRLLCFFSARSCSTSSSEICGTRGRVSRKRLRFGVKPLISLILIIGILFSFSVSSYADSTIRYRLSNFDVFGSDNDSIPQIDVIRIDNVDYTRLLYRKSVNTSELARITLFRKISNELKSGNSYTLSYTVRRGPGTGNISCQLLLSDDPENLDNAVDLGFFDTSGMADGSSQDYSIQLTYPDNFNGKQCYILALLVVDTVYSTVFVSDFIFDNNDKTEEKIDGILEWLSAVYHSIVGGEDSRGVQHDGLVQGIKNGLNSLGNTIGGFFENLKISIENKIDAIQQWFVELGENIIDGIKSLFIPEDGYFESKKAELETFFSEHFGIVYTAGSLSIDVLKKFTSLKPPAQAVLHVPAWQMSLPWENDKVITIVPAMDVNFSEYINSSGVLHTFYKFYRAFITVVIIFMVVNYAKRKFDYVFGKDGEGVE